MGAIGGIEHAFDSMKLWEKRLARLTEKRPCPLDLTAAEILDFLNEYMITCHDEPRTATCAGHCVLVCHEIGAVRGKTLQDAACLAAAMVQEINEPY